MTNDAEFTGVRVKSALFLIPAWFAPHTRLRVAFHRLRGVKIGKDVQMGYHVFIDNMNPHFVTIEDNVGLGPNVTILTHDYIDWPARKKETAKVTIKEGAYIGVGATILKGVTIGRRAIVGAGSLVNRNVEDGAIVAGVPAKRIK